MQMLTNKAIFHELNILRVFPLKDKGYVIAGERKLDHHYAIITEGQRVHTRR
mgnify:CR=1 FL=1